MANEVHPVSWTGSTHQQPLQSAYLQPLLQFSSSFDRPKRNLTQCGLSMPNAFRSNVCLPPTRLLRFSVAVPQHAVPLVELLHHPLLRGV